jgi:uncharacterized protein YjbJ (UPF0337 family)
MGSTSDKVKGYTNEAVGKAKRAIGDAIDDPKLKAEGDAQEARGDVQKTVGKAKDAVKRVVDGA